MQREEIKAVVRETIAELQRTGMLAINDDKAYSIIGGQLHKFYANGEGSQELVQAVDELKAEKYGDIIPLYYGYGYTIERIAETMNVDITTVVRNKKRLALEIWRKSR